MRAGLLGGLMALTIALAPSTVDAQGWIEPLTELRAAPVALEDARAPLADRIALAGALGRHGPEQDAVTVLLATLEREPPPALRDEVLRALTRRAPAAARKPLLARLRAAGPKPPELGLALAAVADHEVAAALIDALGRPSDSALARSALVAMQERAAPALAEALVKPQASLAVAILRELGPRAAAARLALERALDGSDPALALQAAGALQALGDERSAPALARRAQPPTGELSLAALAALELIATPHEAPVLLRLSTHAESERRALALRALARSSPTQAAPLLSRALAEPHAALREAARQALLADAPDASFVPALSKLARAGDDAAASALARVRGDTGVSALIALARVGSRHAERSSRPLALALRRFGNQLDDALIDDARAVLRALPDGPRRMLLRALARDPSPIAEPAITEGADADARAARASVLSLWADPASADGVATALEAEHEPEVARRLCDAARTLGARPSPLTLDRLVRDPATAPEALALWASLEAPRPSRALRVALRRALDPRVAPCTRAAAAHALGAQLRQGDVTAEVPLIALLADPVPRLRLAAVLALHTATSPRARTALAQHARIERDARVRDSQRAAAAPGDASATGTRLRSLELRVLTDDGAPRLLEIWLDDGRCLRQRTLPGGELVIADLPEGEADVRVID